MKGSAPLVVLTALFLSGCGLAPAPVKAANIVDGNSQFTAEGIEAIKGGRKAVFDFTSLPMDMSALGFAKGSDGTLIAADSDKPIDVSITTPQGVVQMRTDTIRIRPGADNIVDNTGRMTFIYSVHLAKKYYTAEARAGIASTGKPPRTDATPTP